MVTSELIKRQDTGRGVHEYESTVQIGGALQDGDVIGRLVILRFAPEITLPYETLRAIYVNSGLPDDYVPKARSASDAWRVATATLKDKEITTRGFQKVKILVRDWERGRSPRRDITFEHQNRYQDQFEYTSPAARIYYDPDISDMIWDNRLDKEDSRERDAHDVLEEMLQEVYAEFKRLQGLIDGDSVQRSIKKLIEDTAPVPMERATWLIWKEYEDVVVAVNKVISALNEYNPEDSKQSVIHILTVVNNPQDRTTVTTALEQTVFKEVELSRQRMANLLLEPDKLFKSQVDVEERLYERLMGMVEEYELKFRKEQKRLRGTLNLLLEEKMRVMDVVAENQKRLYKQRELAKRAKAANE